MGTMKNNSNKDYLALTQLTELIQDIEGCALRLADAARKAKKSAQTQSRKIKESEKLSCEMHG